MGGAPAENLCEPNLCASPQGACCFDAGECFVETEVECLARPDYCSWSEGVPCDPNPCSCSLVGCCFEDGSCELYLLPEECLNDGGVIDGHACEPDRCETVPGACCFLDGVCRAVSYLECYAAGGSWTWEGPGTLCEPNPCPNTPVFACCFADGSCMELVEMECVASGGVPQGAWSDCMPNECVPVAVEIRSWGAIRATYR
ncbi:MAG: hypothetical protein ACE15D_14310 [Candidatus Eisenbacteria bacterium]|nr:hypothetical protein [Candidatus Eisenbacteria bacterium]